MKTKSKEIEPCHFPWPLLSRRNLLATACLLWAGIEPIRHADASPEEARRFLEKMVKTQNWQAGRVKISLPSVTEQGRFVPVSVTVEGDWNGDLYVREIHLAAERNPTPHLVSFYLSSVCWPPTVTTRIRLVKTQVMIAAAVLSNGQVLVGKEICKVVVPGKGCG